MLFIHLEFWRWRWRHMQIQQPVAPSSFNNTSVIFFPSLPAELSTAVIIFGEESGCFWIKSSGLRDDHCPGPDRLDRPSDGRVRIRVMWVGLGFKAAPGECPVPRDEQGKCKRNGKFRTSSLQRPVYTTRSGIELLHSTGGVCSELDHQGVVQWKECGS